MVIASQFDRDNIIFVYDVSVHILYTRVRGFHNRFRHNNIVATKTATSGLSGFRLVYHDDDDDDDDNNI